MASSSSSPAFTGAQQIARLLSLPETNLTCSSGREVAAVSQTWLEQWRVWAEHDDAAAVGKAMNGNGKSHAWPGPVICGEEDDVWIKAWIARELIKMNNDDTLTTTPVIEVDLSHWRTTWGSHPLVFTHLNNHTKTAPTECTVCARPDPEFECVACSTPYCSMTCRNAHWPYHVRTCSSSSHHDRNHNHNHHNGTITHNGSGDNGNNNAITNGNGNHSIIAMPTGLSNLGNTCFLNSSIQCLVHARPMTRYFCSDAYRRDMNEKETSSSPTTTVATTLTTVWAETCKELVFGGHVSISPIKLKSAVTAVFSRFQGLMQHDAQDMLMCLMVTMHEQLKIKTIPPPPDPNLSPADLYWRDRVLTERSFIVDHFKGLLEGTVECAHCLHKSYQFEDFNELCLNFPIEFFQRELRIVLVRAKPKPEMRLPAQALQTRYVVSGLSDTNHRVKDMARMLGEMSKVDPNKLWVTLLRRSGGGCILDQFDHDALIGSIPSGVELTVFEVNEDDPLVVLYLATSIMHGTHAIVEGMPTVLQVKLDSSCAQVRQLVRDALLRSYDGEDGLVPNDAFDLRPCDARGRIWAPADQPEGTSFCVPNSAQLSFLEFATQFLPDPARDLLFLVIDVRSCVLASAPPFSVVKSLECREHVSTKEAKKHASETLTLTSMLQRLLVPEKLDEKNKYLCEKCGQKTRATKRFRFRKFGDILVLMIKRFTNESEKIAQFVEFPMQGYDLSALVGGEAGSAMYDLFAVMNHYGNVSNGHYTTVLGVDITDDVPARTWVEVDDSRTRIVTDDKDIVSAEAYVLMYRRKRRDTGR